MTTSSWAALIKALIGNRQPCGGNPGLKIIDSLGAWMR
jgi:hypothetical protein